jgi:hypothetical protein
MMRVYCDWISDAGLKINVYAIVWREKTNGRTLSMTARWKERRKISLFAMYSIRLWDHYLCPLGPSAESIATPRRTTFVPLGRLELDPVQSQTRIFLDSSTTPSMGKDWV